MLAAVGCVAVGCVAVVSAWALSATASAGGSAEVAMAPPLIPRPVEVRMHEGRYDLSTPTLIGVEAQDEDETARIAGIWIEQIAPLSAAVREASQHVTVHPDRRPSFSITDRDVPAEVGDSGYELVIDAAGVTIRARGIEGVFYAGQTLRQLWRAGDGTHVPFARIVDKPRFAWRGLLQDCSRTFLSIDYLKKYIDVMAYCKLNVFHLHLTDDQGWRVEIKKHPKLTEIGAKYHPDFPDEISGYYTQDQLRDLVRYAADRQVTIVPEIEMPSHSVAVLAAYPELSCRGDAYAIVPFMFMIDQNPDKKPPTPYGVLCAGNDKVFAVMEDVLTEVIDIFPSPYIHIGGDECPKVFWESCPKCQARIKAEGLADEHELQSYFIKRIERFVSSQGRQLVGWDEILEGGLAPGAVVMSWRGIEGGVAAAKAGHDVVMSPTSHCYFDYAYSITPMSKTYAYEPIPPALTADEAKHVLGVQGNMWTHLARTQEAIDKMVFPRAIALAEVAWTPADKKDFADFSRRLESHWPVLDEMGVAYHLANEGLGTPNIAVAPDGSIWIADDEHRVRVRSAGGTWMTLEAKARQVAVGGEGRVWMIGTEVMAGGYRICEYTDGKLVPTGDTASAVQIAAAPDGSLWAVATDGTIWRLADGDWAKVPGTARQVSVGPQGLVYAVGVDWQGDGYGLWKRVGDTWEGFGPPLATHKVVVAAGTDLWLLDDRGNARWRQPNALLTVAGNVASMAVGADGVMWAILREADGSHAIAKWQGGFQSVDKLPK